ncbi:alkyl/aryl-sulfatase [Methanocalculus sp.]|uniref:alkyl/aryl-sulfatase n=1 Tax=Methanocalculus sp. TaxID=2004547 RepID=UPI00271AC301|nr:alkyl sulfatase dimerization domain-containing protein [Methanocalculus sp.]MDO8842341.1 alkyl sulfatase dimerization domain-containing protein [Methanocalculus sp.]
MKCLNTRLLLCLCALLLIASPVVAEDQRNDATSYTRAINTAEDLSKTWQNLNDDIEYANRGLLAAPDSQIILNAAGKPVLDVTGLSYLQNNTAPLTVSAGLYEQARLNSIRGLFQVTDTIYQVRGYDVSVMSLIKGETGWIIIDPLGCTESAGVALDLVTKKLGEYPVKAVIYTHPHVDHCLGVGGVTTQEKVDSGEVIVIAPEGFMEHLVSENVYAGTAMKRRSIYMFGLTLPVDEKGFVDLGIGTMMASGSMTLIPPTRDITHTGQTVTIDGVEMVFQLTPGTEAPVEMNIWFPQEKALCMAENCVGALHNILTIRGAQVRDPLSWSRYLDEARQLYGGEAGVMFTSHNWPRFGNEAVVETLEIQRDMYRYLHDQTLHLINRGYTMDELSHMITLPDSLRKYGYTHEFYGTVQFAAKAVYQKYLGFYDGNPTHLNNPDPVGFSSVLIEYMGGADAVIPRLREDYQKGMYQEVATIAGYIVYSDPTNREARTIQADALEQLGYQSVSGPYRNAYLTAAQELRSTGVSESGDASTQGSPPALGLLSALSPDQVFEYLAIRLNPERADGEDILVNIIMESPEGNTTAVVHLKNCVLHAWMGTYDGNASATISGEKTAMKGYLLQGRPSKEKLMGFATVSGDVDSFIRLMGMFDTFTPDFPIVLP